MLRILSPCHSHNKAGGTADTQALTSAGYLSDRTCCLWHKPIQLVDFGLSLNLNSYS
ncbi:MAG TPA: hypothetical protein V6D50_04530 [Chroococcales cyanobacterium]